MALVMNCSAAHKWAQLQVDTGVKGEVMLRGCWEGIFSAPSGFKSSPLTRGSGIVVGVVPYHKLISVETSRTLVECKVPVECWGYSFQMPSAIRYIFKFGFWSPNPTHLTSFSLRVSLSVCLSGQVPPDHAVWRALVWPVPGGH